MIPFLLSFLGWGKMVAQAVFEWLSKRSLAELGCIVLALSTIVVTIHDRAEKRHSAHLEKQLRNCVSARHADRIAYAKAQADAQAKNAAHIADIEAQQKRISDARLKDANDRLSRLADELRKRGPAAQGHSNGAGSSKVPDPSGGTPGSSGLCLSPSQLLRAAQDEERHNQLIDWIEEQLAIDPNK